MNFSRGFIRKFFDRFEGGSCFFYTGKVQDIDAVSDDRLLLGKIQGIKNMSLDKRHFLLSNRTWTVTPATINESGVYEITHVRIYDAYGDWMQLLEEQIPKCIEDFMGINWTDKYVRSGQIFETVIKLGV